jgi:hypothetical protein
MFSNETIILTDLSRSTPVERDHKFCDTMEKSETEIDKISDERAYERSTTDDMYSNETIILKDLMLYFFSFNFTKHIFHITVYS